MAALAASVLLTGCGTLFIDSVEQLRETNKANIARLYVSMPRSQAESIMGREVAGGKLGDVVFGRLQYLEARNPMREESVVGSDGIRYEVAFYYTDVRQRDDKITDDELTPVVFRDDRVAGIGYGFLGARVPKYLGLQ